MSASGSAPTSFLHSTTNSSLNEEDDNNEGNNTNNNNNTPTVNETQVEDEVIKDMNTTGFMAQMKGQIAKYMFDIGRSGDRGKLHIVPDRGNEKILSSIWDYLHWVGMRSTAAVLLSESPVFLNVPTNGVKREDGYKPELVKMFEDKDMEKVDKTQQVWMEEEENEKNIKQLKKGVKVKDKAVLDLLTGSPWKGEEGWKMENKHVKLGDKDKGSGIRGGLLMDFDQTPQKLGKTMDFSGGSHANTEILKGTRQSFNSAFLESPTESLNVSDSTPPLPLARDATFTKTPNTAPILRDATFTFTPDVIQEEKMIQDVPEEEEHSSFEKDVDEMKTKEDHADKSGNGNKQPLKEEDKNKSKSEDVSTSDILSLSLEEDTGNTEDVTIASGLEGMSACDHVQSLDTQV